MYLSGKILLRTRLMIPGRNLVEKFGELKLDVLEVEKRML